VRVCARKRVDDGQWHVLNIKRRASQLEAQLDDCRADRGL